MKRYYLDVENKDLIQILDIHEEKQTLNLVLTNILEENRDDLLESIKDDIKEKYNLYSNLNKKLKK